MSYSTLADWEARATPKVVRSHAAKPALSGSIQTHLDSAQTIVDGYIQGSYDVPLSDPPQFVKDIELRIASFNYLISEGVPVQAGIEAISEQVDKDYIRLRDIAMGKITLPADADATPNSSEGRCTFKSSSSTRRKQSYRNFNSKGYEVV